MGLPSQALPALGEAIRTLRAKKGISQEDLAHDAGITTGTLSRLELGLSNPTWSTVNSLAAGLRVSMVELVKQADKLNR